MSRNRCWATKKRNTNIRTVRGDKAVHADRMRVPWRSYVVSVRKEDDTALVASAIYAWPLLSPFELEL